MNNHEKLVDILVRLQSAHFLYQYADDYTPHEEEVDRIKNELLELLCPGDRKMLDLDTVIQPPKERDS